MTQHERPQCTIDLPGGGTRTVPAGPEAILNDPCMMRDPIVHECVHMLRVGVCTWDEMVVILIRALWTHKNALTASLIEQLQHAAPSFVVVTDKDGNTRVEDRP